MLRIGTTVCAALLVLSVGISSAQAQFDHLRCFKIEDHRVFAQTTFTLAVVPELQQFPFQREDCTVEMPAVEYCVNVAKENVTPAPVGAQAGPEASSYLCYKLRHCSQKMIKVGVSLQDQFGTGLIGVKKPGLVCAPVTSPSCTVVTAFGDTAFPNSGWSESTHQFGASYPALGSMDGVQSLVNGCSAPSRTVSGHVAAAGAAGSGVVGVHLNLASVYDPSVEGAITHFDYDESSASIAGHQATGPALQQNGNDYVLEYAPIRYTEDTTTCAPTSVGSVTASQMCLVLPSGSNPLTYGPYTDCTQHPDFTDSGSEITFGFFRANSAPPNGGAYDTSVTMDNWQVRVCSEGPPAPCDYRCTGGVNDGLSCTADSDCPGGVCVCN